MSQQTLVPLRDYLAGYLATRSPFNMPNIRVTSRRKGDVVSLIKEIEASVQLGVIVLAPLPVIGSVNIPGPEFEQIRCDMLVVDNPKLNQTGIEGLTLCETLLAELHHHVLPESLPGCGGSVMWALEGDPIVPTSDTENSYLVSFTTNGGIAKTYHHPSS
jgi:hypothetical protein